MLSSPFASLPAFNEILLLENRLGLNWDFNAIDVAPWKLTLVGTFNGRSGNQKTLVSISLTIMNLIKCSGPGHARGAQISRFLTIPIWDIPLGVWLLKFSSLLPHLSIATGAQNSHLGYFFFLPLIEDQASVDHTKAGDIAWIVVVMNAFIIQISFGIIIILCWLMLHSVYKGLSERVTACDLPDGLFLFCLPVLDLK